MFYTYIWKDAAGVPFYVGKGTGRRFTSMARRSFEFMAEYDKGGCTVEIVDEFIFESQAFESEIALISEFGRREFGGILVNKTDGGEGTAGHIKSAETRSKLASWVRTPELRAILSAAHVGKTHSADTKAKISLISLNSSPETRAKISASNKGKKRSAETRSKMSAAQKGKKTSLSHRAKIGTANSNPSAETRAKMSAAKAGRSVPQDVRLKMRDSIRLLPSIDGFKGVSFRGDRKKWRSYIKIDGRMTHLGYFASQEEAARAYDAAAISAWGYGNCYLNFPEDHKPLAVAA